MPWSWSFNSCWCNCCSWISCSQWSNCGFLIVLRRLPAHTFSWLT
jgi:hypothetical protein